MFELRLARGKVYHIGMLRGLFGGLTVLKAPDFYRRLDWQIVRQAGSRGTWNVKPLTEHDLTVEFANRPNFCRSLDVLEDTAGIGFIYLNDLSTNVDVFLSAARLSEAGASVYEEWSQLIASALGDIAVEIVLRLNVGACTEPEIAAYREGKWLGTKDIDLQIRPRTFR